MSEYQYYEFVAVDQPLSDEQVRALRALSTRAQITSTRFVNHYDWGNFRGNPRALMEECFDLFVYVANWGMRCFMMRLPRRLFDPASTAPYFAAGDVCAAWATREHVILHFERSDIYEDDLTEYEFDGGGGWLAALTPLRQELLQGDQRCLYLAWLLCVQTGLVDDEAVEPPVPLGIQKLSASFQRTSAEVLAARAAAKSAEHYARLVKASNEARADCWEVVKLAELRMVEEIDKGQERGEVATDATGGGRPPKTSPKSGEVSKPATFKDLKTDSPAQPTP